MQKPEEARCVEGKNASERILPTSDLFASCPNDGGILEYYAGTFEAVFVQLHPFLKTEPASADRSGQATNASHYEVSGTDAAVSWAEVAFLTGLPSLSAIDIGLRTMIGGLRAELANREFAETIGRLAESQHISPPSEGFFSPLLYQQTLSAIQALGYEWVWVGDEFCTERKLHWIEDLKIRETDVLWGPCNIFTPDKALLWTTHWDSHFSLLCSSKNLLDRIEDSYHFEGFFCTPSTEIYWSLHS